MIPSTVITTAKQPTARARSTMRINDNGRPTVVTDAREVGGRCPHDPCSMAPSRVTRLQRVRHDITTPPSHRLREVDAAGMRMTEPSAGTPSGPGAGIGLDGDPRRLLRVVELEDRIVLKVAGVVDDAVGAHLAEVVRIAGKVITYDQVIELDLTEMQNCTVQGMRRLTECARISERVRFRYG
jgi:hypothetical protein